MTSTEALLGATGLHAGFQLVVTVLVYPVLVTTPAASFAAAHDRHSRRIVPLVALVYTAAAAACGWVLIAGPWTVLTAVACAGTLVAALSTALVAAPTHGRLGARGPMDDLVRRLLLADRVRLAGALVAVVAAVLAAG